MISLWLVLLGVEWFFFSFGLPNVSSITFVLLAGKLLHTIDFPVISDNLTGTTLFILVTDYAAKVHTEPFFLSHKFQLFSTVLAISSIPS